MKWLSLFKKSPKLKLGDKVVSTSNFYGFGLVCEITRIYDRSTSGDKIKYCRLEFEQYGFKRTINVMYKSCKKVEQ